MSMRIKYSNPTPYNILEKNFQIKHTTTFLNLMNSEKRCYTQWTDFRLGFKAGGKIVWLTDNELLMHQLDGEYLFVEITNVAIKKVNEVYMHQTVGPAVDG